MTAQRFYMPNPFDVSATGVPYLGGNLYFYASGTTTLQATYSDAALTTANPNPVPADTSGHFGNIFLIAANYKVVLQDANGVTVWTIDPISGTVGTPTVNTIAALQAATVATLNGGLCDVLGYSTIGDGGFGAFYYVASDTTSADNGGTIIVDASGRRWYRDIGEAKGVNLLWFGGSSASSDNSAALNRALAAISVTGRLGGLIFAPAGKFTFLSAVTFNLPGSSFSLSIAGAAADATVFYWPNSSGLILNGSSEHHSFHISDISLTTGTTNAWTAVTIFNSVQGGHFGQSDFTRVTIRGDDGGGVTQGWTTGINVSGWCNINYTGCLFYGGSSNSNGIVLSGYAAGAFQYSIVHNIASCGFFNLSVGLTYGTLVQGVTVNQSNLTNCSTGIWIPTGVTGADGLAVTGSQFDCTGNGILIQSAMTGTQICSNLFYITANGAGIGVNTVAGYGNTIVGNTFFGKSLTATYGLNIDYWTDTTIAANYFQGLATGISLQTHTTRINVDESNSYNSNTANLTDGGTGNSQTWQDVTSSRALGTTYTNTTSRTILVSVAGSSSSTAQMTLTVSGIQLVGSGETAGTGGFVFGAVPSGATYSAQVSAGTGTLAGWKELR